MKAVLDSGPIIHLSWIHCLDFLRILYDEVIVPTEVRDELMAVGPERIGYRDIVDALEAGWLKVQQLGASRSHSPIIGVDRGEAAAILLAEEIRADIFVTDDRAARRVGFERGFTVTGTLGILR